MTEPFIIYSMPRSRTAWLSAFLSYKDWTCHHEMAVQMRSISDVRALFSQPRTGTVETGVAQGWWLVEHEAPGIKKVVVRRPVIEVVQSLLDADLGGVATYDRTTLGSHMTYTARMLDKIASQSGVLVIDHADLVKMETAKAVFEHCLPYGFDVPWWGRMKNRNIQVSIREHLRYYHENIQGISTFKRNAKSYLRELRTLKPDLAIWSLS